MLVVKKLSYRQIILKIKGSTKPVATGDYQMRFREKKREFIPVYVVCKKEEHCENFLEIKILSSIRQEENLFLSSQDDCSSVLTAGKVSGLVIAVLGHLEGDGKSQICFCCLIKDKKYFSASILIPHHMTPIQTKQLATRSNFPFGGFRVSR